MRKRHSRRFICEAIAWWRDQLRQLNEWTEFHPSSKKSKYYIVVDYSCPPTNYAQYVTPSKQLTGDLSNGEFAKAATTVVPQRAREMAEDAVQRWGMPEGMYVFLYRDRYSVGRQTQLNHSRSNVVDIWSPQTSSWRHGLEVLDQAERGLGEADASDFVSDTADIGSFIPSRSQPSADWAVKMQDPEYREKWERRMDRAAERREKMREKDPWAADPDDEKKPGGQKRHGPRLERSGGSRKREEEPPAPPSILKADDVGEIHTGDLFHMLRARPANAGWTTMKTTVQGIVVGEVNEVLYEGGKCIMRLAPWTNGRDKTDRSVDPSLKPLFIDQIARELEDMPPDTPVVVQMRGQFAHWRDILEKEPESVELDSRHGLFLRLK